MRKTLFTLGVSLLLCGGAAAAAIASSGQSPGKPVQLAMLTTPAMRIQTQAPRTDGGAPATAPGRGRGPAGRGPAGRGPAPAATPADRAARMARLCQDRYARAAGNLAYLEARLDLTAPQSAAFARWRTVQLDIAKRQAASCAARPAPAAPSATQTRPAPPSPVERLTREQTQLQQRLANIQAERPALEALYNILTPEQRQRFHPAGMMGRGAMGRGPMRASMMGAGRRGPNARGPMGFGRNGRGGPGFNGRGPNGPGSNNMGPRNMGPGGRGGPNPPPPQNP